MIKIMLFFIYLKKSFNKIVDVLSSIINSFQYADMQLFLTSNFSV